MTITADDIGRLLEKRDNPRRQFVIVSVTGDTIRLHELLTGFEFSISDTRTYDFVE